MSLENLARIGQLKPHPANRAGVERLLAAARRSLADAGIAEVSRETRFDAADKAIMQASLSALMARGYRPATDRPGHHQTMVQSLTHTIGVSPARIQVLDTPRRQRNVADYLGDDLDESSVRVCREEAAQLLRDVKSWLASHPPELG